MKGERDTIKKYFKFPTLQVMTNTLNTSMEQNPLPVSFKVADKNSLIGIEVECENLHNLNAAFSKFWQVTEDGSLRNCGKEFITPPIRGAWIEYALRELFSKLPPERDFSPRTSVHVHLNVRTLTSEQVCSVLFLVILFEKAMFKFVGENRDENIHCVPLRGTTIVENFPNYFPGNINYLKWMKYSAVNFVPVAKQGTLEFRHMHGTDNLEKLMAWINIILCIKKAAYMSSHADLRQRIFELNSNSSYISFAQDVFGPYVDPLQIYDKDFSKGMAEGVTLLKQYSMSKEFESKLIGIAEGNRLKNIYSDQPKATRIKIPTPQTAGQSLSAFLAQAEQVSAGNIIWGTGGSAVVADSSDQSSF